MVLPTSRVVRLNRIFIFAIATGFSFFSVESARATGFVKVESDGFLRRSEDQPNSSQTIAIGPHVSGEGDHLKGELDVQGIVQVQDRSTFTVESKNAYLATSSTTSDRHEVTLGRRVYDWSEMDDTWQLGIYSPRFLWDPLRPETVGLTGAFYEFHNRRFRFLAFASPVNVPERGFPQRESDGKIDSSSRFYVPLYDTVQIAGTTVPINYHIMYPNMSSLLFQPNGVMSLRYMPNEKSGWWAQAMYGVMPVHQVNISAEIGYLPQQNKADVYIHPRVLHRHLVTFETGVKMRRANLWASVSEEAPIKKSTPEDWTTNSWEPAQIASLGGNVRVVPKLDLNASLLYVSERPSVQDDGTIHVELPGRFNYHKAARAGLTYFGSPRIQYGLSGIYDIEYDSTLASLDIQYSIERSKHDSIALSVGADLIASATNKGYIGQYQGNDRIRGAVQYEF